MRRSIQEWKSVITMEERRKHLVVATSEKTIVYRKESFEERDPKDLWKMLRNIVAHTITHEFYMDEGIYDWVQMK